MGENKAVWKKMEKINDTSVNKICNEGLCCSVENGRQFGNACFDTAQHIALHRLTGDLRLTGAA